MTEQETWLSARVNDLRWLCLVIFDRREPNWEERLGDCLQELERTEHALRLCRIQPSDQIHWIQ